MLGLSRASDSFTLRFQLAQAPRHAVSDCAKAKLTHVQKDSKVLAY